MGDSEGRRRGEGTRGDSVGGGWPVRGGAFRVESGGQ